MIMSSYLLLEGSQFKPGVIRFGLGDILNVHCNVANHPVFKRCETGNLDKCKQSQTHKV